MHSNALMKQMNKTLLFTRRQRYLVIHHLLIFFCLSSELVREEGNTDKRILGTRLRDVGCHSSILIYRFVFLFLYKWRMFILIEFIFVTAVPTKRPAIVTREGQITGSSRLSPLVAGQSLSLSCETSGGKLELLLSILYDPCAICHKHLPWQPFD